MPWRQVRVSLTGTCFRALASVLDKALGHSEPQCPHLSNEDDSTVGRANQGDIHRSPRWSKDHPFRLLLPGEGPAARGRAIV